MMSLKSFLNPTTRPKWFGYHFALFLLILFSINFIYLIFAKHVLINQSAFPSFLYPLIKAISPHLSTSLDLSKIYSKWAALNLALTFLIYIKRNQVQLLFERIWADIQRNDSGISSLFLAAYPLIMLTSFLGYIHYGFFVPGIASWTYPDDMSIRVDYFPPRRAEDEVYFQLTEKSINKEGADLIPDGVYKGLVEIAEDSSGKMAVFNNNIYNLVFPDYVIARSKEVRPKLWRHGAHKCTKNRCGLLPCEIAYPAHAVHVRLNCPDIDPDKINRISHWSAFVEIKNKKAMLLSISLIEEFQYDVP